MRVAALLFTAAFTLVSAQTVDDNSTSTDTTVSSSQFWHERYHGLLSMAAYGDDPTTACAQTFTQSALLASFPDSTEAPWTIIQQWGPTASGTSGFAVIIPEMDKVVMVFKGLFGWESSFNQSTTNIGTLLNLGTGCANCTAHAAATQAYIEAKEATDDWAVVKQYVNETAHQWSITGHGFGGMIGQVASIDLGWRGLCHWTHNHGAARVFNADAASLFNSLYAGEASQRVVANNDIVPTYIPESADYTFTLQGFHIVGNGTSNATYGYDYEVCNTATDPNCLGGEVYEDTLAYYTPIGMCGNPYYGNNETIEANYESTASAAFYATATSTFTPPPPPSTTAMATVISSAASSASTGAASAASDAAKAASSSSTAAGTSGAAGLAVKGAFALAVAGFAGALVL